MDIDKLKDLMGRVTPGPWEVYDHRPAERSVGVKPVGEAADISRMSNVAQWRNEETGANANLFAMAPDLAAEVIHLTAERDQALTDLGKVIMALPHGEGMRIEGAVDGVRMLRAERDQAVAALRDMTAENARLVGRDAEAMLVAHHVRGNCPLCKGTGKHRDIFAEYRTDQRGVLEKLADGTAIVDCPWCKSARAFLAG